MITAQISFILDPRRVRMNQQFKVLKRTKAVMMRSSRVKKEGELQEKPKLPQKAARTNLKLHSAI